MRELEKAPATMKEVALNIADITTGTLVGGRAKVLFRNAQRSVNSGCIVVKSGSCIAQHYLLLVELNIGLPIGYSSRCSELMKGESDNSPKLPTSRRDKQGKHIRLKG